MHVDGDLDESIKRNASDRLGDLVPQVRARTSPGVFRDLAILGLCLDFSFSVLYCRTQANLPTLTSKRFDLFLGGRRKGSLCCPKSCSRTGPLGIQRRAESMSWPVKERERESEREREKEREREREGGGGGRVAGSRLPSLGRFSFATGKTIS